MTSVPPIIASEHQDESTDAATAKPQSSPSASLANRSGSPLNSLAALKNSLGLPVHKSASGTHTPVVPNANGYLETTFAGKQEQAEQAIAKIRENGFIPAELVEGEVTWFYDNLGIDNQYFAMESVSTICDHIISLYGAKILAYTKHSDSLEIDLEHATSNGAVFIHSSPPGASDPDSGAKPRYESVIDEKYIDKSTTSSAWRLETYRSKGNVSSSLPQRLRCYFLSKCNFVQPVPSPDSPEYSDIRRVSDAGFLSKASSNTLEIYQDVMSEALSRTGPVIEVFQVEGTREHRIVIGYRMGSTHGFFSALSSLYHYYSLFSSRKYVEHFSNDVTIVSLYLNPLPGSKAPPIEHSIHQVTREASLVYCLPDNPFFKAEATESAYAVQEAAYAYVGWLFAQHFCNRLGQAYQALRNVLDETNLQQASILNDIKLRFREETFTRQSIQETLQSYPELVRLLYVHFAAIHYPKGGDDDDLIPTLSYQRLVKEEILTDEQMYDRIRKTTVNQHEFQVLEALLLFNKAVLKCNFYTPTKVALSFRLDAKFLPEAEYPVRPFGIFFVVGSDFRGFHVRFKDVARGGIRVVRSRNRELYSVNQRGLFDEVYNLALTQQKKNKDLPEGGSKGAILPSLDANPRLCFEKFCDSLIDLLLEGQSPGVKEKIVDLVGKEEILFLGPDEGTADCMDWAAGHARERGAPWWKSFTTGKTAATLGGIPHDVWGMTSLSVRQYTTGIMRKLGLKEEEVTKVQTGGPDGDLGSNEILLSTDKTVAIIDGSGVIHDPQGLDREELTRLARGRKMISDFDISRLSKGGYRVLVEENDVKLPSGEIIPDGVQFRNQAHLLFKADLFVPCGGRPESINISNVNRLFDAEGKPHFKYVVEGANLFVTKQARTELERRGVILYPDASANKGGVTSSSLEVLCGLSLSDEEYQELMVFKDGKPSKFYLGYVRDVQNIIAQNARKEFEAIWRESQATSLPRSLISSQLSDALNSLSEELEGTNLFQNVTIRNAVLSHVFPGVLQRKIGLEASIERIPEAYAKSAFAAWLAADFVYKNGPQASHVSFYQHLTNLSASAPTS